MHKKILELGFLKIFGLGKKRIKWVKVFKKGEVKFVEDSF